MGKKKAASFRVRFAATPTKEVLDACRKVIARNLLQTVRKKKVEI